MYLIRENVVDGETDGYWVDQKLRGQIVESFFVQMSPRSCSCCHFAASQNIYNHFHILLVENWLKTGKPTSAIYTKGRKGKIQTLCAGFVAKNQ